jgi:hypothetical protein
MIETLADDESIIAKETTRNRRQKKQCFHLLVSVPVYEAEPHILQTFNLFSPSAFSHKSFTPVRLQDGQVPRQSFTTFASLPRFGLGMIYLLSTN